MKVYRLLSLVMLLAGWEALPIDGIADALPYRYSLIRVIDKVN